METTLPLEKGEIVLSEEKILIRDDAKKAKWKRIGVSAIWLLYGILSILRYTKTGDEFLLWTGAIIAVGHAVAIVYTLFKRVGSEIVLNEIERAIFKDRNGNKFLDLKLRGGSKRRISKVAPVSDDLRAFFLNREIEVRYV